VTNNKEEFPTHEQIKQRAFEIYVERGGEYSQALADWLTAEEELSNDRLRLWAISRQPRKKVWRRANAAAADESRRLPASRNSVDCLVASRFLSASQPAPARITVWTRVP
jgi:hypothetical protein